ncbi:MAG: hypothetical protein M0019_08345 [Actinomycetota bacterium]|nr:hypothetical protein [Actinomycetota bacterium]
MGVANLQIAKCSEIWGGNCDKDVVYPDFQCPLGHNRRIEGEESLERVIVHWDGSSGEVDVEAILRSVLSPYVGEQLVSTLLEQIELTAEVIREIAQAPNLPLNRFGDCLKFKQVPRRALELMVHEMLTLLELDPGSSWLSGFSKNEVPPALWETIAANDAEFVTGPVPKSAHNANLEKMVELSGDPVFHHTLIGEICRRELPKDFADSALAKFKAAEGVDKWDLQESIELIEETYKNS